MGEQKRKRKWGGSGAWWGDSGGVRVQRGGEWVEGGVKQAQWVGCGEGRGGGGGHGGERVGGREEWEGKGLVRERGKVRGRRRGRGEGRGGDEGSLWGPRERDWPEVKLLSPVGTCPTSPYPSRTRKRDNGRRCPGGLRPLLMRQTASLGGLQTARGSSSAPA